MIESEYLKDNRAIVERLRRMPTLELFEEKHLQAALQLSKIRKYAPGESIIEEGTYDCWIYYLVSGKVKIVKEGKDLGVRDRRGDVFGEMGVIDGSPRSASVYAINETVCLATDASYLDRLSGKDKVAFTYVLYRIFCEVLANRLRSVTKELVDVLEEIEQLTALQGGKASRGDKV